jgi:hypothetical protein
MLSYSCVISTNVVFFVNLGIVPIGGASVIIQKIPIATSDICHAFLLIRVHIGEGETLSFHKICYRYTKTYK